VDERRKGGDRLILALSIFLLMLIPDPEKEA